MILLARTYSGGIDLFHACPNLKDAKIIDVTYRETSCDYGTILTIVDKQGLEHKLTILQEK